MSFQTCVKIILANVIMGTEAIKHKKKKKKSNTIHGMCGLQYGEKDASICRSIRFIHQNPKRKQSFLETRNRTCGQNKTRTDQELKEAQG